MLGLPAELAMDAPRVGKQGWRLVGGWTQDDRQAPAGHRVIDAWWAMLALVKRRLDQHAQGEPVEVPWTLPALRREWN